MSKFSLYTSILASLCVLTSCAVAQKSEVAPPSESTAPVETKQNGEISLEIKSGSFVYPYDEDTDGDDYLALEVEVTNHSQEALTVSAEDMAIYDDEGEKTMPLGAYDMEGKFETLRFEDLPEGKRVTGYVVFEVEANRHYSLEYIPMSVNKVTPIKLDIVTSDYQDHSEEVLLAAESYINQVFLTAEKSAQPSDATPASEEEKTLVDNEIEEERQRYIDEFKEIWDYTFYYYKPKDDERTTLVTAYTAINAQRAEVNYEISSYYPNSAVVYVSPKVVDISAIDKAAINDEFIKANRSKYTEDELFEASDKAYLQQLPSLFETAPIGVDDYMDSKGFKLLMIKGEDGIWKVDTSDYRYKDLLSAFFGGA